MVQVTKAHGPVYWPVHYAADDTGSSGMCLFDDETMARGFCQVLEHVGGGAWVGPPVRLTLFNTYQPLPT